MSFLGVTAHWGVGTELQHVTLDFIKCVPYTLFVLVQDLTFDLTNLKDKLLGGCRGYGLRLVAVPLPPVSSFLFRVFSSSLLLIRVSSFGYSDADVCVSSPLLTLIIELGTKLLASLSNEINF